MSPAPSPKYGANYLESWHEDVRALGFSAKHFDSIWREPEFRLCDDPWMQYTQEIPASEGMRIMPTRQAFPDIPPLYVFYRFNGETQKVDFCGLSPACRESETF